MPPARFSRHMAFSRASERPLAKAGKPVIDAAAAADDDSNDDENDDDDDDDDDDDGEEEEEEEEEWLPEGGGAAMASVSSQPSSRSHTLRLAVVSRCSDARS